MSKEDAAAQSPLPVRCCAKCAHADENVMGMGGPGALFCVLNPPSIAFQVARSALATPKPEMGLIYIQPMVQPGNRCSHFKGRDETPFPLLPG